MNSHEFAMSHHHVTFNMIWSLTNHMIHFSTQIIGKISQIWKRCEGADLASLLTAGACSWQCWFDFAVNLEMLLETWLVVVAKMVWGVESLVLVPSLCIARKHNERHLQTPASGLSRLVITKHFNAASVCNCICKHHVETSRSCNLVPDVWT